MNKPFKLFLLAIAFGMILSSCSDDESPASTPNILGEWFFKESSLEMISTPSDIEITLNAPDVAGLKWVFQENDSLYIVSPDTTLTNWYNHDIEEEKLFIASEFYDVLKLSEDSLNLRVYTDLGASIEFYTYFKLTRQE